MGYEYAFMSDENGEPMGEDDIVDDELIEKKKMPPNFGSFCELKKI